MLEANQEYMLAKRWREDDDLEAAHELVTSHLRLVAKIAMGYRGYGLPVAELRICAWSPRSPWVTVAMACRSRSLFPRATSA
jgi:hypothetical protein